MSMSEIAAMAQSSPSLDRQQAIGATSIPTGVVHSLAGKGIHTVGALLDTDAFKTITSGRYDIDSVREVNGIPIAALRWALDEIVRQMERGDVPLQEALKLFEEGTTLVTSCNQLLDDAELKVMQLTKGADGTAQETEFTDE